MVEKKEYTAIGIILITLSALLIMNSLLMLSKIPCPSNFFMYLSKSITPFILLSLGYFSLIIGSYLILGKALLPKIFRKKIKDIQ